MDGVTIGQIGEWLLWAVGIGGAIATVCKFLTFAFQRTLNKALEPTNKKIDEINRKVDLLEAKHDGSEMGRIKDFLVEFLARIERGEPVDEEELERFWENYDFYNDHGGNSYIHSKMEKLKARGKL